MTLASKRKLSVTLFMLGVVVGLVFNTMSVWADLEASLFDAALTANEPLNGLSCPVLITQNETGVVNAYLKNTTEREMNTVVRTHITDGFVTLMREEQSRPSMQPGETIKLQYAVTAEDAAWERFILVRVYTFRKAPLPSRTGSCGIWVVNLPFGRGWMVTSLVVALSAAGIGAGWWLWRKANSPLLDRSLRVMNAMSVMGLFSLAGLVLNLFGLWLPAAFMLVATIVLMAAMMAYFVIIS
jgi:hypothetical protein